RGRRAAGRIRFLLRIAAASAREKAPRDVGSRRPIPGEEGRRLSVISSRETGQTLGGVTGPTGSRLIRWRKEPKSRPRAVDDELGLVQAVGAATSATRSLPKRHAARYEER